ncbi:hypothetical protein AQI84_19570 [Streptomyces griseorubiginosus]|nr:hypothetical protein AQI84_19570 [Streptomyces griseorubiginosus]
MEFIEPVTTGVLVPPRTGHTDKRTSWHSGQRDRLLTTQAGDLEEDLVDRPKTPFLEDFGGLRRDLPRL